MELFGQRIDFQLHGQVQDALFFAAAAHAAVGQVRKYSKRPYIVHPIAVANILYTVTQSEAILAAALMHDVVEDTGVELYTIEALFGLEITQLVSEVTDVSRPEDGNRAFRKELDRQHLAKASAAGQTIKLADLIDNTISITEGDPDFARVYIREKHKLLEVLTLGDRTLHEIATNQIVVY